MTAVLLDEGKDGESAAVLISPDDLDPLRETVFWAAQGGVHEDIAVARAARGGGATVSAADVRGAFGLPSGRGR